MASELAQDPYTTMPPRSRGGRRDRRKRDSDGEGVQVASEASRGTLLRLLHDTVANEHAKLNVLLSSTALPPGLCSQSPENWNPQAHSSRVEDPRIADKNEYLNTPVRLKLFPRASSTVLRTLLATPPSLGGDFSLDVTGIPLSDFASGVLDRSISYVHVPTPPLSARKTRRFARCYSDFDAYNLLSGLRSPAGFPTPPSHPDLPPSPPPSTELPCSEFLPPRPESVPSSSPPPARPANPSLGLSGPYTATRRSSHERSPLSRSSVPDADVPVDADAISPARRAAPCVPVVTRAASASARSSASECDGGEGDGESRPSTSISTTCPRPGPRRPADPRLLMRNDLASGVVRAFQRVLDELQGLGYDQYEDQSGCTESLGDTGSVPSLAHSPLNASLPSPSPSPPPSTSTSPPAEFQARMCGPDRAHPRRRDLGPAHAHSQPAGLVFAELADSQASSLGPDLEKTHADANEFMFEAMPTGAKQHTPGGFSSWERRLRLADCGSPRSAGGSHALGGASPLRPLSSSSPSSSSFYGLQEEFVVLLSDQALEEESHAQHLREIAERLEEMARCRRHLAAATAMKQL